MRIWISALLLMALVSPFSHARPSSKYFLVKKTVPPCPPPLVELAKNLEYDQEVLGLYVPKGWTPEIVADLYIGRARIVPTPGKLYSIGWKPTFVLENIRFGGSTKQLGELVAKASAQARSPILIRGALTTDSRIPSFLVAEKGNWKCATE